MLACATNLGGGAIVGTNREDLDPGTLLMTALANFLGFLLDPLSLLDDFLDFMAAALIMSGESHAGKGASQPLGEDETTTAPFPFGEACAGGVTAGCNITGASCDAASGCGLILTINFFLAGLGVPSDEEEDHAFAGGTCITTAACLGDAELFPFGEACAGGVTAGCNITGASCDAASGCGLILTINFCLAGLGLPSDDEEDHAFSGGTCITTAACLGDATPFPFGEAGCNITTGCAAAAAAE
jgi:hypothetical protein